MVAEVMAPGRACRCAIRLNAGGLFPIGETARVELPAIGRFSRIARLSMRGGVQSSAAP